MNRSEFRRWCRAQKIEMYADPRLSRLLKDKFKCYEAMAELGAPQPHTEMYDGSRVQHSIHRP